MPAQSPDCPNTGEAYPRLKTVIDANACPKHTVNAGIVRTVVVFVYLAAAPKNVSVTSPLRHSLTSARVPRPG